MKYHFITFIIILFLFTDCSKDGIVEAPGNEITPLKTDITNQSLTELLNERIPGMIDNADIPGLQMAVIKNSNILWSPVFLSSIYRRRTGSQQQGSFK